MSGNMFYLGNKNLPNSKWRGEYTKDQVSQLKKAAKNILYFAENFFFIINLDRGREKIKLYAAQKRALRKMRDNRFYTLLASRQIGKSTLMTIYLLWQACFNPDQRILLVANKEATAIEIFSRVRMAYEELPNWLKPPVKEWAKTSMELENGSKISITTTTGTAARGQSCNCLVIDECAFIEPHLIDEFWKSVFPIITSSKKSKVFMCSTSNGTGNLFHRIYQGAVDKANSWAHDRIMWDEVPGRDEAWAQETKTALDSHDAWLQEFCCEFLDSGDSAIDTELFEEMSKKCCAPKIILNDGNYRIWEEPNPDKVYVVGVDTAEGVGADGSCMQVLDITDLRDIRQVATFHSRLIPPSEYTAEVYKILRNWGSPLALIERNNCGAQIVDRLLEMGYEKVVSYGNKAAHRRSVMQGMIAHTNTKFKGVTNMRYFINDVRAVTIFEKETLDELKSFVRHPNGSWKARKSLHDDRVMALLYALFILEKEIAERFFEITEIDDYGKPSVMEPMDFGITYFEDPTSIYLDNELEGLQSHTMSAIVWDVGDSDGEIDGMAELESDGWTILN